MHVAARYATLCWRFIRIHTLLLIYLHMVFFYLCLEMLWPEEPNWLGILGAFVAMGAVYANATAVNDLSDEATDSLNLSGDSDRPLVSGQGSRREVWGVAWFAAALALAASLLIGWETAVLTAIMLALNYVYSMPPFRLSGRGVVAQLLLPLEYVVYPAILVYALLGNGNFNVIYIVGDAEGEAAAATMGFRASWGYLAVMLAMYVIFIGRLFLKDIRDEHGDRATGKRTFTVRHSAHAAIIQSAIWTVAGTVALSVLMFLYYDVNPWAVFGFCALSLAGQLLALVQCDRESNLAAKVRYTGIYSRWISMKIFFYIVLMILATYHLEPWTEAIVLLGTVVMVVCNVFTLYAGVRAVKPTSPWAPPPASS
ncbi:MAG: UbiA family prenyltransferase [Propionibacteriaceae bacterium]|jgi:4-hydroxybenzoate polyprenyltransferase|nr:UbiA family prenyltransferase [Propionibacteriaceae bacterium]